MIQNKIGRIVLSIIFAIVIILGITVNSIYAATENQTLVLNRDTKRYTRVDNGFDLNGETYSTTNNHNIFQIFHKNESNNVDNKNYYCANALVGDSWANQTAEQSVTYTNSYDLVTDKSIIDGLDSEYIKAVNDNWYTQLMWLFDNMYVSGDSPTENTKNIKALLAKAGIKEDPDGVYKYLPGAEHVNSFFYSYKDNDQRLEGADKYKINGENVILSETDIESIQQYIIWYYANYKVDGEEDFNCKTENINMLIPGWKIEGKDENSDEEYKMKREQAAILCNYLIDSAEAANEADYVSTNNGTLSLTSTGAELTDDGENYKIGPITLNMTGNAIIENIEVKTGTELNTNATYTNLKAENGNTISMSSLKNGDVFYIVVPKTNITDNQVKVIAKGSYSKTIKTLWISYDNPSKKEQPIVEVQREEEPLESNVVITNQKQFDLALRKYIVKVNGVSTGIVNEDGNSAVRKLNNIVTNAIPDTATYKHRKDPVVVSTGNTVTYRIAIFNEGDIDGYASKIVDQLPTGLKSKLATGTTVKSNLGNQYDVVYDDTTNTITFTMKTTSPTSISALNDTTLSNDYIEIECEVTQTAATDGKTKHYLTNIAYIAEAYDKNGNKIEQDRNSTESKPSTYPTNTADSLNETDCTKIYKGKSSNNDIYTADGKLKSTSDDDYFEGQQDDDDFETIVVLPKEFDLKLIKYISAIQGVSTEADRKITVDSSKLNTIVNGKKITTADYDVSKVPLGVETGDLVTYTFRIYNEGEIDGYAQEIAEDIPEGLAFVYLVLDDTNGKYEKDGHKYNAYEFVDNVANMNEITNLDNKTFEEIYNTNLVWKAYEGENIITRGGKQCIVTDALSKEISTDNLIKAFDQEHDDGKGSGLSRKEISVIFKVITTNSTKIIRNEVEISDDADEEGNPVDDRDSKPEDWKRENSTDYYEDNSNYPKYKEDDEDYDNIKLKVFDLSLRKFITKVSSDGDFEKVSEISPSREPQVDVSKLKTGEETTAIYKHSKKPITLQVKDFILYTIRVYNEGDVDGYASEITDYLPEYLNFVNSSDQFINNINKDWKYDSTTRKLTTRKLENTVLNAFNAASDSNLHYADVQVVCQINSKATSENKITNIAEITEYKDKNGTRETDRDSKSDSLTDNDTVKDNLPEEKDKPTYKDNEINKEYVPGQEDDDDFEKVAVREKIVDLALTKFITAVSKDTTINDGEYLTPNKKIGSKTNEYIRATIADTTGLKAGTSTNATYTAKKDIETLVVEKNSYVLYNIRVYNEGETDVYAGEVTDYLPENLEFVEGEFNKSYGWNAKGQVVTTTYLSKENGTDKILKAFDKANDNGKGSGLDYKDLPILCKVSDKAESGKKLVNTAEITKYEDENGKELPKDIDSTPKNKEEKNVENRSEDDDDYEVILVKNFDLALRKFITDIGGQEVTTRIPQVSYDKENKKIVYTHPKDVLKVHVDDVVTYTLRVFNEGDLAGYAQTITDDIPEYLEYLPENDINKQYRWKMFDKDGKETTDVSKAVKIVTDYTSKENGEALMQIDKTIKENPNLLNAFDSTKEISNTNPDYVDVKVAFKVKDPNSNKYVIVNKAQISEDADENGDPVDDVDSIPDEWNEGEDDQDYENVSVEYFDLSLLKYVAEVIVTENGKTTKTKTGNTGSDKDIIPKVEIYRKSIKSTVVKFKYTIKITNEGDIAGYAKEITDYVPKGLKFYKEDNNGWTDEGNNVISTKLLENTLLQPGQSATVTVVLRWINGENNLSLKKNIAEISEDDNDQKIPDRDSTPDNKKDGEDDIDDASVLLTISTGIRENVMAIVGGGLVILLVLAGGIWAIKRYVL